MKWSERNLWLLLAAIVSVVAWQLTRLITHVDRRPQAPVTLTIDQRPWARAFHFSPDAFSLQQNLRHFAGVAMLSEKQAVFFVTPSTRSIVAEGIGSAGASCAFIAIRGGVGTLLSGALESGPETPIAVSERNGRLTIPIASQIDRFVARGRQTQAAVVCRLSRPLSVAPTFTERSLIVRNAAPSVPIVIDISALENIDDLRFSGGIQLPLGGERVRVLYDGSDVLSIEWSDVSAQERRDIILVLIGALSAIAAATVIEAIRPSIEVKSRSTE